MPDAGAYKYIIFARDDFEWMDRGTENLDLTKELLEHYNIQQTLISAYHPQANDLV